MSAQPASAVAPVGATTRTPAERVALRRRAVRLLLAGVALGSTGHIAAVTVATIVAEDLSSSAALAGVPGAAIVVGAAAGSAGLAAIMARRGRRIGLATGYLVGVIGALIAIAAVVARSYPVLLLGTAFVGFGNSANHLSRYAAADMFPADRRASAIGTIVWGSTVGAVIGPNLVAPAGDLAQWLGLPVLAGAYLVPIAFVGVAALLTFTSLRPDPYELAEEPPAHETTMSASGLRELLARPAIVAAIVALVVGQAVMVLIMTMTPLHMTNHGHGLGMVGLVVSAHTFGMFALSPISGRLTDRFGTVAIIFAGTAVLALSAILAAIAPGDGGVLLLLALFLLGWGWNLGFVAGSTLLTGGLSPAERTRLQGLTDAVIWTTAAAASFGSGVIVAGAGYATLGFLGAAVVALPVLVLLNRRRHIAASGAA